MLDFQVFWHFTWAHNVSHRCWKEEELILALVPPAHVVWKERTSSKNLAPDQNFSFLLSVFLSQGAIGNWTWNYDLSFLFQSPRKIIKFFSRCWGETHFLFHLTSDTFLTRVSWTPHISKMVFALLPSSFHFISTASKTLGMRSVRPCLQQPRFEGCNRLKVFKPQNNASNFCSVSNEMLSCGSPCSLCWVNGWLSLDAV